MFANPVWSVLILFIPIMIYYYIIRPRLRAKFTDLYAHVDGFWARLRARLYAFRSFIVFCLGIVAIALPDILVAISGLDLSFLPKPWPMWVSFAVSITQTLLRAYSTTPREEPS